jgi:hypothetical protein
LPADDVGITDVVVEISGRRGGKLAGTFSFDVTVAQGGEYEASSPDGETKTVTFTPGLKCVCRVPIPRMDGTIRALNLNARQPVRGTLVLIRWWLILRRFVFSLFLQNITIIFVPDRLQAG